MIVFIFLVCVIVYVSKAFQRCSESRNLSRHLSFASWMAMYRIKLVFDTDRTPAVTQSTKLENGA